MNKLLSLFIFTSLLIFSQGQILNDYSCVFGNNYYFQWKDFGYLNPPYFSFVIRSHAGTNGYTYLAVTPQKGVLDNALIFALFTPNGATAQTNPNWYRYRAALNTTINLNSPFSGLTLVNETSKPSTERLVQRVTWRGVNSNRPTLLYNEFTAGVILNITLMYSEVFNAVPNNQTNWYVYSAVNFNKKPTGPSDLPSLTEMQEMKVVDWRLYNFCFVPGVYRWSVLTIPTYVIELFFYLLLIPITAILGIFYQPLKSRGFTPPLAAFSQFVVLLAQIHYLTAPVETAHKYDCLINIFLYYASTQISLILLPIHLVRYIFIINLNQSKNIFVTQIRTTKEGERKTVEVARWPFRIVKLLTNPWLNFTLVVLWFIFTCCLQLIIFFALNMECSLVSSPIGILQTIWVIIFIICWIVSLIWDFIAGIRDFFVLFKETKAKEPGLNGAVFFFKFIWEQFSKRDPFYYRFEIYFIGPAIIAFFIIISLLTLIFKIDAQRDASIGTSSTLFHMLLFYQVLFPLIITIYNIIVQCFYPSKKVINEEIDKILFDKKGHDIFAEFAKSEWSTENISCYDDIQRFKNEKDKSQRLQIAEEIFITYLNGSKSKLEVNVNASVCAEVKRKLDDAKNGQELDQKLLDHIESGIKLNLCDTFSRLRLTQQFKEYAQKVKFVQETLQ